MRIHNIVIGSVVLSTTLFASYFRTPSVGEVVDIPETFEQRWSMNIPIKVKCRHDALMCGWLWQGLPKNPERLHVYRDISPFAAKALGLDH
jgi:hypothetical protein